ncbi:MULTISPECIES: hypothetical protein [Eikenella]|uniref:DUF2147 domain-containing protein n=1 Tax=Eikenella longinqua TaxID=1795827 RepID=A0A1A9RUT7_9NEIS|nr:MULTISPECIES: hypothetical protein [Eikenella]OAM26800.1 hypothetical protein A7P95_08580 [Eikenella longinqua]
MKAFLPFLLLATALPAIARPPADFSGHWVGREVDGSIDNQFKMSLEQQGDTVSGKWSHSISRASQENVPDSSGKVRGIIRNGRLTLEYCTEKSPAPQSSLYPPCPQYHRSFGYYVLQSDDTLMERKDNGFRPETYIIWHRDRKN